MSVFTNALWFGGSAAASALSYRINSSPSTDVRADFRAMFDKISSVANITFTDSEAPSVIEIYQTNDNRSYAYYPNSAPDGSDVHLSTEHHSSATWSRHYDGTFRYVDFLHETGHALGLTHVHNNDTPSSETTDLLNLRSNFTYFLGDGTANYNGDALNRAWFTVMSYDYSQHQNALTPMILDAIVLADKYGSTKNTGNSNYSFSNGSFVDDRYKTIVDSSGNDTIDVSTRSEDMRIELGREDIGSALPVGIVVTATGWQNIHDATGPDPGTLTWLYGQFETAIGGSGNDYINGNSQNNFLSGGMGNDSLYGLAGADTLSGGGGNDTLDGGDSHDLIQGGDGNDSLLGGAGNDSLIGGAGNDIFTVGIGTDSITDLGLGGAEMLVIASNATANATLAAAWTATSASSNAGMARLLANNFAVNLAAATGANGWSVSNAGNAAAVSLTGSSGADTLAGGNGADSLIGGAGNDTINGDNGNDSLIGGNGDDIFDWDSSSRSGADTMVGGAGNDVYVIDSELDIIVETADQGTDLVWSGVSFSIVSLVHIENASLFGLSSAHITGNEGNNVLTGNDGANSLIGGNGADSLIGGLGNDSLLGGAGNDSLIGGAGNDIFSVEVGTDSITDLGLGGADVLVISSNATANATLAAAWTATSASSNAGTARLLANNFAVNLAAATGANGWSVSNAGNAAAVSLTGSSGADTLAGGNGADSLIGGAGNDSLIGGAGNDSLIGGAGNDIFTVGAGTDSIPDLGLGGADVLVISSNATANATLAAAWTATSASSNAGIARLLANNFAVSLAAATGANGWSVSNAGNAAAVSLTGSSGADTLTGGHGADSLIGGAGNDIINGGNGNDSLIGGNGDDTFDWASSSRSGADTMVGGAGNDVYVIDSALDVIVENSGQGTDIVWSENALSIAALANIENASLFGSSNVNITGNDGNNLLTGNDGANSLTGGNGADTLIGGAGNDSLIGGAGNDVFTVGAGTDSIADLGLGGADVLFISSGATATATLAAAWTATSASSNAGIARLLANNFAVNLAAATGANGWSVSNAGNAAAVSLTGSSGADTLTGGNGADSLIGGAGNDTINGGAGNDSLIGGNGDDTFDWESSSRSGADTMVGGAGNDVYVIDSALDVIIENSGQGTDIVWSENALSIAALANVEKASLFGSSSVNITGNDGNNILTGNDGANSLTGGNGADNLIGGPGNDSLIGGAGNDSLIGGAGNDIIDLTETSSAPDAIIFAGGSGIAGSLARISSLGLDTISGINLGTSTTAVDTLRFSAGDFGIAGGTVVTKGGANLDGNFYITTAAPIAAGVDLNGSSSSAGAAIVFAGASSGTAGVSIYFTTNESSFSNTTAVEIARLVGMNTSSLNALDIQFVL